MKKGFYLFFTAILLLTDAQAQNIIPKRSTNNQDVAVGVNIINPYRLSIAEQNDMLSKIKSAGIHVIRASITLNDAGVDFAQRAWDQGIQIEWLIYHFGGYDPFGHVPLSAADPEQFRNTFAPILSKLEEKGIILTAFELGNEINLSGTNPEFPIPGKGVRPKGDIVSINSTIEYMRAHGLDSLVDGYAIHIYPWSNGPGDASAATGRKNRLANFDLKECQPIGSKSGKPGWITEWGFNNTDMNCPINDTNRTLLVKEMMNNYRPYVQQGRLVGLLYFSWNSDPLSKNVSFGSIFRCGALTESGKSALDPGLLK